MKTEILAIRETTLQGLRDLFIEEPKWVTKKEFTKFTFDVIDPISDTVLTQYFLTELEFSELSYEDKKKYKNLKKSEEFDEKSYKKAERLYKKEQAKYEDFYNNLYKKNIEEQGITEKEASMFSGIMDTVVEYIDFNGYGDYTSTRIEFEENILASIRKEYT